MQAPTKETILKQFYGYDSFREGQSWLIDNILLGNDVVGVMPTGAGKSICFQVPAMLFDGITIVISPLISLMKDQVNSLTQAGINAAFINSSLSQNQYNMALDNARNGKYKIIYVAPERLFADDFLNFAQNAKIAMVTIDEAHCISHWGQDFRPSYVKIVDFIDSLPTRPIVSAFTATATAQVRDDIINILKMDEPKVLVTGFDRKNLYFEVQKPTDKFTALTNFLQDKQSKTGVIYCSTRKNVEEVCDRLCQSGFKATRYHAGLSDVERKENQDDFIFDRFLIIVATNAFGMGIDKSNVSFVVHYNMPKNIESYYQEAGRAGRDGEPSDCILLYSGQDVRTNLFLIESSKDVEYVDAETERLVKERDRERLKEMTFYCHTNDCLREYILKYFGEIGSNFCGNCGSCNTNFENIDITVDAQKIISCVKRADERYGIKTIIDILRGSKNEKILRLELDKISTYNIMENVSEKRIRDIINYLVLNEYLFITNDEFPVIKMGSKASEVLFNGVVLQMKLSKNIDISPKEQQKKATTKGKSVNPVLMDTLKQLRFAIANEQKVPAFVVFSDATLIDMCVKLPKTHDEFLNVSGVGQVKLEKYGDTFLDVIAQYTGNNAENLGTKITLSGVNTESEFSDFCNYMNAQKSNIKPSDEPIPISVFTDIINGVIAFKYNKKISAVKISNWLVENGYLQIEVDDNGKNYKSPTPKGTAIGIETQLKTARNGDSYNMNYYNKNAQEILIENLEQILIYVQ